MVEQRLAKNKPPQIARQVSHLSQFAIRFGQFFDRVFQRSRFDPFTFSDPALQDRFRAKEDHI